MAGHSKWANIRFRKGAQDAKRAKIFTKCIREITIASRIGGADPGANPRLRTAIDKGLANNMPKDKIEKAIKRGTGDTEGVNYEEIRYEGYGPGGVAVLVDCTTDNRNRTVSEVRHAFTKMGGNLGTDGSVAYLFSKLGVLTYADGSNEEAIMDAALEAGADDVITDEDGSIEVITTTEQFAAVRDAMAAADLKPEMAEISQRASTQVTLSPDDAETMLKLLDALEDLDDVQNVYSNADFPDEVLQQQAG
ncbi:MAG TPA: YebC/PmpR family DNA-binding transcriptional regulator [Acidiferrobacteraceae bacterium]|jgi:YebC/PmpR family DNA-binding regulatory protein|nr:YebC/PmpR family DNA-binding transcriptional regulator [Acidiferrobacteraceae bacterium]HEX19686.1 YebC/PmpR family DNA-binding transcriptional regulator [Acidiferrobacteraceae bacterium]